MSATLAAPSQTATADKGTEARERLFAHKLKCNAAQWERLDANKKDAGLCACCGATSLNKEGTYLSGLYDRTKNPFVHFHLPPLDVNAVREAYMKFSPWEGYNDKAFPGMTKDQFIRMYIEPNISLYVRGNKPGVTFAPMSMADTIKAMYTQDNKYYGTVAGIEINDKEDGLCSLIWTNA